MTIVLGRSRPPSRPRRDIGLVAATVIVVAALAAVIAAVATVQAAVCNRQGARLGLESDYRPFVGCRVRTDDGWKDVDKVDSLEVRFP